MGTDRFKKQIEIKNKRASYEYEWLEKITAGIVLMGTEIKSIREGKASITEGHCYFHKGEMFLKGARITPYNEASHYNHDPERERKLLLKRSELNKLIRKVEEKGLSLVPVRLYINDRGLAKLNIILGRGKKLHDKRATIKEREARREMT